MKKYLVVIPQFCTFAIRRKEVETSSLLSKTKIRKNMNDRSAFFLCQYISRTVKKQASEKADLSCGKGRLKVKSEIADFRYRRKNGYHGQKEKTDIRDRRKSIMLLLKVIV